LNSTVIQNNKSSIVSGLKTLASGEYEVAERSFLVDIEKTLKELVENYVDPSKLRVNPSYNDYIDNLWSKIIIRKSCHERGVKENFCVTKLRNAILHGKESHEDLTKAVMYIMNFIASIDKIIYDIEMYKVLSNELMEIEYIPKFEEVRAIKILDTATRVKRITLYWAEENEKFLNIKEDPSTITDINHFRLTLKIHIESDSTEIQINI